MVRVDEEPLIEYMGEGLAPGAQGVETAQETPVAESGGKE
jgi:hypothetical protein